MKKSLTFFITLNKLTGELTLQEGALISFKIPKHWQKPDPNPKSSALWICHLPVNSLGISSVSFYPTELVIKKKKIENKAENKQTEDYEAELESETEEKEENILIYKGTLEPNGENEKESFFRCKLWLQKEKEEVKKMGTGSLALLWLIVVVGGILLIGFLSGNIK